MAFRAKLLAFPSNAICGVAKRDVVLRLSCQATFVPENLSCLVLKYAHPDVLEAKTLRIAVERTAGTLWHAKVRFPVAGQFVSCIEWDGVAIDGGIGIHTIIETGNGLPEFRDPLHVVCS